MTTFTAASRISVAATRIDDLKAHLADPAKMQETSRQIEELHNIARELAGDRVGEIYDETEDLSIVDAARMGGCSEACLGVAA